MSFTDALIFIYAILVRIKELLLVVYPVYQ